MKRFAALFLIVALAFVMPGQAFATTLTHNAGQVEITVPDNWKSSQDGDSMTITAPDEAMAVVFNVLDANIADKALETMDKELEKAIGTITWDNDGKYTEEDINGMKTYEYNGKAKGGAMLVDCLVVDTPSPDKSMAIYWFSTKEAEKKYEADIATIVKGLKPLAKK